jgi:hypothetical protein
VLFFPVAFLLKTPLAALGLIGAGMVGIWSYRRTTPPVVAEGPAPLSLGYRVWPLLALVGVYGALALRSNVNIGLRHLLPLYPAVLILAGGTALFLEGARRRFAAAGLALAGGGLFVSTIEAHPNELAWTNTVAGGPARGYVWLVDSSSDWGEDLPALKRWLDDPSRPAWARDPFYLAYFGVAPPEAHGLRVEQIDGIFPAPAFDPNRFGPGAYIVSPTVLQGGNPAVFGPWSRALEADYSAMFAVATAPGGAARLDASQHLRLHQLFTARLCSQLRRRPADARVGTGFLVYRVDRSELDLALRGPPVELIESLPARLPLVP